VAYKLLIPDSSQRYPVIHVSQWKQVVPLDDDVAELPSSLDGYQISERVLQRRISSSGDP